MIKYLILTISLLLSGNSWGHGSSHAKHSWNRAEAIRKAEAMKYDRCQYHREGNNLVGLCTNWDGENPYKTVDIDYFKEKEVNVPSVETLKNLGNFQLND